MRIQVLGPVRAWLDNESEETNLAGVGQRAVLGLLAMAKGQPVSRAELVDALWPAAPPKTAVNVIQTHVKGLRRILEPERPARAASQVLHTVGDGYALRLADDNVDLWRFRGLASAALVAEQRGDHQRAAGLLADALRLWQARPLADVPLLGQHPKVVSLTGERRAAVLRYGAAMIASGAAMDVLAMLEELAAADPLDEAAQALFVRALQATGLRRQAFRVWRSARRRLSEELGIGPGSELLTARAALLGDHGGPPNALAAPASPHSTLSIRPRKGRPDAADAATTPATPPATLPATLATLAGRSAGALGVPPRQLPAVGHVVGRIAELDAMSALLGQPARAAGSPVVIMIDGTAGVGKTTLALHWAHRVADRFPDGQLYANLRAFDGRATPMELGETILGFLAALGVPPERTPAGLTAQIGLYRSLLAGKQMLLVLDNARDSDQVLPLLPGSADCFVVVTSRNRLMRLLAYGDARLVTVRRPSRDEAVSMLVGALGGQRVAAEPSAVDEIITWCARLPLALAIIAARAKAHPRLPLADLARELRSADSRLDAMVCEDLTVRAAFSWSHQALTAPAARLFRLLGLHTGPITSIAAASLSGMPVECVGSPLAELVRAHLLAEPVTGQFTQHELLRRYAAELCGDSDSAAERGAARQRMCEHYLHTAYAAARVLRPDQMPADPPCHAPGVTLVPFTDREDAERWLFRERPAVAAAVRQLDAADGATHLTRLARFVVGILDEPNR